MTPEFYFQIEQLLRILLACVLGCIIGHERMSRDKSAGMRTHAIVCMGAALIMVVSKYCFRDVPDSDGSRIAAQIVSGVGFLGAGIIFVRNNNTVSGLTTAAGIWTTAGVGMAVGAGAYFVGVSSGLMVVILQILLHRIRFLSAEPMHRYVKIKTEQYETVMNELQVQFQQEKIKLLRLKVDNSKRGTKIELELLFPAGYDANQFVLNWSKDKRVLEVSN